MSSTQGSNNMVSLRWVLCTAQMCLSVPFGCFQCSKYQRAPNKPSNAVTTHMYLSSHIKVQLNRIWHLSLVHGNPSVCRWRNKGFFFFLLTQKKMIDSWVLRMATKRGLGFFFPLSCFSSPQIITNCSSVMLLIHLPLQQERDGKELSSSHEMLHLLVQDNPALAVWWNSH